MSDTPIIDAAIRAGCKALDAAIGIDSDCRHPSCDCGNKKTTMLAALRAALLWEPNAETIETMAGVAYHVWFGEHASPKWDEAVISKETWRAAALASYRAQPIMRELYPEQAHAAASLEAAA
jgi:hypothetical protein